MQRYEKGDHRQDYPQSLQWLWKMRRERERERERERKREREKGRATKFISCSTWQKAGTPTSIPTFYGGCGKSAEREREERENAVTPKPCELSGTCRERWGAGVETQKNVRGEIG